MTEPDGDPKSALPVAVGLRVNEPLFEGTIELERGETDRLMEEEPIGGVDANPRGPRLGSLPL